MRNDDGYVVLTEEQFNEYVTVITPTVDNWKEVFALDTYHFRGDYDEFDDEILAPEDYSIINLARYGLPLYSYYCAAKIDLNGDERKIHYGDSSGNIATIYEQGQVVDVIGDLIVAYIPKEFWTIDSDGIAHIMVGGCELKAEACDNGLKFQEEYFELRCAAGDINCEKYYNFRQEHLSVD